MQQSQSAQFFWPEKTVVLLFQNTEKLNDDEINLLERKKCSEEKLQPQRQNERVRQQFDNESRFKNQATTVVSTIQLLLFKNIRCSTFVFETLGKITNIDKRVLVLLDVGGMLS